jgi:hypothetical protein
VVGFVYNLSLAAAAVEKLLVADVVALLPSLLYASTSDSVRLFWHFVKSQKTPDIPACYLNKLHNSWYSIKSPSLPPLHAQTLDWVESDWIFSLLTAVYAEYAWIGITVTFPHHHVSSIVSIGTFSLNQNLWTPFPRH